MEGCFSCAVVEVGEGLSQQRLQKPDDRQTSDRRKLQRQTLPRNSDRQTAKVSRFAVMMKKGFVVDS